MHRPSPEHGESMRVLLVSDAIGLGIMEARPEPAWLVRLAGLRNKDLLAPDYGAMNVAAYLKAAGFPIEVVNLVADVHDSPDLFHEPNADPDAISGAAIGEAGAARASREHLFKTLRERRPDVILFPLSIYNIALYLRSLLADIREACPETTIVAGGIYSTFFAREILEAGDADIVVRGEGEVVTSEVLRSLAEGVGPDGIGGISYRRGSRIVHNPSRDLIGDLDALPHPYTVSGEFKIGTRFRILSELTPGGDYIPGGGFLTSRGCPEACTFCLDPALNGQRTRFHSPEYVRGVVQYCHENFTGGAGSFFFGDATFTMNRKRLRRMLELIEPIPFTYQIQTRADYLDPDTIDRLAACRFTTVAIGAESFNERILQDVAKKRLKVETILEASRMVREAGMNPVLTFIVGLPGETRDSVRNTVEILRENGLHTATFFPLVVFRGTALFEMFRQRVSGSEMERLRLNPYSEEYLFTSDEFPTREELTAFTEEVNTAVVRGSGL